MKAWRIPAFGIDKLSLDEVPALQPGPGQIVLNVHAVSLNYRDLMMVKGAYNPKLQPHRIPCSDGAGTIAAIGGGVTQVAVGDRVAGTFFQHWLEGDPAPEKFKGALGGDIDGTLAQQVLLQQDGVVKIPDHLSFEEAATLPCAGVTAWNAVTTAGRVKSGDTVLIQGTGGVSCFALQFAKALGARVLGTSSSPGKLRRAAELGLDTGHNSREDPEWARWAVSQTDGHGVDLTVEVGGAGTFQQSMAATRIGGVVAQIGVLTGREQVLNITPILHKMLQIRGIYVGSRQHFLEMNRAIAQTGLRPVVDRVFSFGEAREAFATMEDASHFGKIVISVTTL
ncbi:MAG TPA: NAD(P)-dependent alcohol dehydrogenase [Acidobacteriaceae bacterium]|jgi:NADPH:quinone reductase-like Zn-dependent oxidoreductase|nr:NAD(P)-dependent alcohol dehydrogenase [Acidobacteriaceae bacterium]